MEIIRRITFCDTFGSTGRHLVAFLCLSLTLKAVAIAANPVEEITPNEASFYGNCQLPSEWHGKWYFILDKSETVATMQITDSRIDIKGDCKNQLGSQYLFMDIIENDVKCWRYMVFFKKHNNVIQFKETDCLGEPTPMENAVFVFQGYVTMITMFRASPQSEPCPIPGPFHFKYSHSSDRFCSSHTSKANSCASSHRLKFAFESCPEIRDSNKWEDEIVCFASWSETDGKHYFAAKLVNDDPEEEQFRCFSYEKKSNTEGIIGRSADASCRALDTLKINYTAENKPNGFCKSFPHWLIHDHQDHNRKRRWHSLTNSTVIHDFHHHEWLVRRHGDNVDNISVSTCIQENLLEPTTAEFIVHTVKGCENYDQCIKIFRRTDQVVEILEGKKVTNYERSSSSICSEDYFNDSVFETLLLENSAETKCPSNGRYNIEGCTDENSEMFFGCTLEHQFVVNYKCDDAYSGNYNCHGDWKDGNTHYLVVREQNTGKRRCFVYMELQDKAGGMSFFDYKLHPCKRGILNNINTHNIYNVSLANMCNPYVDAQVGDGSSARPAALTWSMLNFLTFLILIYSSTTYWGHEN